MELNDDVIHRSALFLFYAALTVRYKNGENGGNFMFFDPGLRFSAFFEDFDLLYTDSKP